MVSVCWQEEFFENQIITDVAKAIFDLVSTIENIKDPVIPGYPSRFA